MFGGVPHKGSFDKLKSFDISLSLSLSLSFSLPPSLQGDIAVKVAHILRNYGDEFQARFEQDETLKVALSEAFLDTDTGEPNVATAASHIRRVVERLFDVDINGVGQ